MNSFGGSNGMRNHADSPRPSCKPAAAATPVSGRGFTLLEVLVVVFIIGVIMGLALLSVDDRAADDRLEREAQRLYTLLDMASEEAVLFGVELGLELTKDGYRFLRLDADGWTPISGSNSPLRPRKLDPGIALHLIQDDEEKRGLTLTDNNRSDAEEDEDEDEGPRPAVLFLSSGEVTPFELLMTAEHAAGRYRYRGQLTGELEMDRETEERP